MPAGSLSHIRRSFPVIYKGSTGSLAGSFTPVTLKGFLIFALMSVSYGCPLNYTWIFFMGFPGGSVVKNLFASARDSGNMGLIPGSERFPEGGNGNPFQSSCLENPMDSGVWLGRVHGVAKSWTQLRELSMHVPLPRSVNKRHSTNDIILRF